jgi:hypothetical protein
MLLSIAAYFGYPPIYTLYCARSTLASTRKFDLGTHAWLCQRVKSSLYHSATNGSRFSLDKVFFSCTMPKRNEADTPTTDSHVSKRPRATKIFLPIKVASQEAAAAADAETPLSQLEMALDRRLQSPQKGDCVVYWMRMSDLRSNFTLYFESHLLTPFSQS